MVSVPVSGTGLRRIADGALAATGTGVLLGATQAADWWTQPLALLGVAGLVVTLPLLHRRHRDALVRARADIGAVVRDRQARHQQWQNYAAGLRERLQAAEQERDQEREHALELLRHVVERQVPAVASGQPVPAPPAEVDVAVLEQLQPIIDGLLGQVAAAGQNVVDRMESQRQVMLALTRKIQADMHRVQAQVTMLAEAHPDRPEVARAAMELDHLAAQAARHCQSVAVVCDGGEGQHWQEAIRLAEIAQAAAARIEPYQRVRVTGDPELAVSAAAAEPVIHLLAEVLDNAAACSPDRTMVRVDLSAPAFGALIVVDDQGPGIGDQARLVQLQQVASGTRRPELDELGEVPRLGLAVVGRHAARLGVTVTLENSPYGGLRVVLLLPGELVEATDPRRPAPPDPLALPTP
ncbi:ATP-binding protein, partial [Actinomadura kijaniata]|uniref:ATP-binding protein n=1 Tax=Actinomadura kijaniata TaxID=46161 RepID=UPI003F1C1091